MHSRLTATSRAPLALFLSLLFCSSVTAPSAYAALQGSGGGMDLNAPTMRIPIEHWGCTNCHVPSEAKRALIAQRPGPNLTEVGHRASAEWMRRWIAKPALMRGAPAMPRLFDDSEQDQRDLDALVAFLVGTGTPAGGAVAKEEHVISAGRELYHSIGCVACHGALESPAAVFGDDFLSKETPAPFVLHSFGDLKGKWYPTALAAYLLEPQAVHPDGRMPSMDLTEGEADLLATYLLTRFGEATTAQAPNAELAKRGEQVFAERGCQACHALDDHEFEPFVAKDLDTVAARGHRDPQGCLSREEWPGPRYDFPAPALTRMFQGVLMAATNAKVAEDDVELDQLARRVYHLNCTGCHEIEGQGGVVDELQVYFTSLDENADLGDEGRFPPHLNDVGAKLTTSWFEKVLKESGRARPYLAVRMPQYGHHVDGFPELFAKKAGVEPHSDTTWPPVDDEKTLLGRELMGAQAMTCVNCHTFGDFPPVGTPGPDMTHFAERLRYEWWDEYIKDPAAKKPGTRMPGFMNGDKSAFENFAGGDFQKQTDAMWAYFSLGEFMPAPEGVGKRASLSLNVGDEPRIFRSFLDGAGSRGIAVGFPVGIHYAYDAAGARLMQVWRGSFIDASGAWAGRGGNVTGGQGPTLWEHPGGPAFVFGAKPDAWPSETGRKAGYDYRGYRTGAEHGPVFQLRVGEVNVVEQNIPRANPEPYIERRFVFDGTQKGVPIWFRPGGELRDVNVEGALSHGAEEGQDGESWYRVTPKGTSCAVILELTL
jgi:mono/diheme cytochrome c family protein